MLIRTGHTEERQTGGFKDGSENGKSRYLPDSQQKKVGKIKKGKYTYIIFSKDFPKSARNPSSASAEVEETTGNRLALLCLVAALQRLRRPSLITIHTDNRYLQNGYQSLPAWKENGWTRPGNKELRNVDLWQQVDKLLSGHAVRFKIET